MKNKTLNSKWEIDYNDGNPGLVFVERTEDFTKYIFSIYVSSWAGVPSVSWCKTLSKIAKTLNKAKVRPNKDPLTIVKPTLKLLLKHNANPK